MSPTKNPNKREAATQAKGEAKKRKKESKDDAEVEETKEPEGKGKGLDQEKQDIQWLANRVLLKTSWYVLTLISHPELGLPLQGFFCDVGTTIQMPPGFVIQVYSG